MISHPLPTHHAQSETVVEAALGVFAAIASCPGQFRPVLGALLNRFRGDTGALLLQVRGWHGGGACTHYVACSMVVHRSSSGEMTQQQGLPSNTLCLTAVLHCSMPHLSLGGNGGSGLLGAQPLHSSRVATIGLALAVVVVGGVVRSMATRWSSGCRALLHCCSAASPDEASNP